MKTLPILLRVALCASASLSLGGCLTSTPYWDAHFGESVSQIRSMQTLNPDASANTDPVAGVDGTAAVAAQTNYGKSFTTPPPPVNVFAIGVGTSGTSN